MRNIGSLKKVCILFLIFCCISTINVKAEMDYSRLSGTSRYDTGKAICDSFGDNYENIILVSGEDFPDALCSAPLSKKLNAPIVITPPRELDSRAEEIIKNKGVKKVTIIGNVITKAVEEKIYKMGVACERIGGNNRYETSVLVAKQLGSFDKVAVVYGENYPDALSIAPIAATYGMPIILVQTNYIDSVVKELIKDKNITASYIIGGSGVISEGVKAEFPNAERIAGATRYRTNLEVVKRFANDLNLDYAYVSSGLNFPDALCGTALAQKNSAPILLISEGIDLEERKEFSKILENKRNIIVLGAEGAVSKAALYYVGVEKKPEAPKPQTSTVEPPSWTSTFYTFNASETTKVYIRRYASSSSEIVGYGYGSLQEVKMLGSSGEYYYIEALDYGTLNYVKGYVHKSIVKTITPSGPYNILVDKSKQRVYIFNNSTIVKEVPCSTGTDNTPTPSGRFLVGSKGYNFVADGGAVCYYWTRLDNNYLFHSVLYDGNGYVIDSEYAKLGSKASHGCIRLPFYDAKWIYDNVGRNTLVTIKD